MCLVYLYSVSGPLYALIKELALLGIPLHQADERNRSVEIDRIVALDYQASVGIQCLAPVVYGSPPSYKLELSAHVERKNILT